MNAVFADSFYWIALLNPRDAAHAKAMAFNQSFSGIYVTTQSVLTEILNACSPRKKRSSAAALIRLLQSQNDVTIEFITEELFNRGLAIFENRSDKEWSLTDCISFIVMLDYDLTDALTGDHHFEQAGFTALLK